MDGALEGAKSTTMTVLFLGELSPAATCECICHVELVRLWFTQVAALACSIGKHYRDLTNPPFGRIMSSDSIGI